MTPPVVSPFLLFRIRLQNLLENNADAENALFLIFPLENIHPDNFQFNLQEILSPDFVKITGLKKNKKYEIYRNILKRTGNISSGEPRQRLGNETGKNTFFQFQKWKNTGWNFSSGKDWKVS